MFSGWIHQHTDHIEKDNKREMKGLDFIPCLHSHKLASTRNKTSISVVHNADNDTEIILYL